MTLTELEALARAATPGTWHWKRHSHGCDVYVDQMLVFTGISHGRWFEDCQYITAVNPDTVLKLIAVARASKDFVAWWHNPERSGWMDRHIEPIERALSSLEKRPEGE